LPNFPPQTPQLLHPRHVPRPLLGPTRAPTLMNRGFFPKNRVSGLAPPPSASPIFLGCPQTDLVFLLDSFLSVLPTPIRCLAPPRPFPPPLLRSGIAVSDPTQGDHSSTYFRAVPIILSSFLANFFLSPPHSKNPLSPVCPYPINSIFLYYDPPPPLSYSFPRPSPSTVFQLVLPRHNRLQHTTTLLFLPTPFLCLLPFCGIVHL